MKISQRIELLQKEYFGEPKDIDRGHFLWEDFLVFLDVDKKCKELDGSDAELLRRAYEIAVNLSRRFTTRERGESLGSMFTRFWAQRAASENGPEMLHASGSADAGKPHRRRLEKSRTEHED